MTKVARVSGIALLMASTTTAIIHQPSYAGSSTFQCAKSQGKPTTFVRMEDGRKIPIIRWSDEKFFSSRLTALERCKQVSYRFQQNYDSGNLRTIISGKINSYPVVCAAVSTNDVCTNKTVLFTLKPGSNARQAAERLLDKRGLASGKIQNQNSDDTQIYVDFDTFLNNIQPEP
ncbi:MAG: COP23 domain-containing protein [Nostoc sp. S4]|nr:COP23 domain-containing protein [Nostoc sp. S4]